MKSIEARAGEWMIGRDTGLSSQAICGVMLGADVTAVDAWSHPHDPADLGRCLRLLALIPEWRQRLPEMKRCGKRWTALVDRWDALESAMASEVGIDWSKGSKAPITYKLMKDVLRGADMKKFSAELSGLMTRDIKRIELMAWDEDAARKQIADEHPNYRLRSIIAVE